MRLTVKLRTIIIIVVIIASFDGGGGHNNNTAIADHMRQDYGRLEAYFSLGNLEGTNSGQIPSYKPFHLRDFLFGVRCLPTELSHVCYMDRLTSELLHPLKSLSYSMEVPGGATPLLSLPRTCTGIMD